MAIAPRYYLRILRTLPFSADAWKCGGLVLQSTTLSAVIGAARVMGVPALRRPPQLDARVTDEIARRLDPTVEESTRRYLEHRVSIQQQELFALFDLSVELADYAAGALQQLDTLNSPNNVR